MSIYGKTYTWKVVYYPTPDKIGGGYRGVALIEAIDRADANYFFQKQYAGQYSTIDSIEKVC